MTLEANVWNKNNAAWRQMNDSATLSWDVSTKEVLKANVLGVPTGAISTAMLADGAVTTAKITDANVTLAKIASIFGGTTIASGSLPAAATLSISAIAATYSFLVLQVTGWSQGTNTARLRVRMGNSSVDSTAANYVGNIISGTTVTNFTTNALASMVDGTTQTTAQTGSAVVVIEGYTGAAHRRFNSRILANTTESQCFGTYIGAVTAIDIIEVSTSAAGNFSAGTYALIGYR